MSITATELKNNLGKYLLLSAKEDIFITKNGKNGEFIGCSNYPYCKFTLSIDKNTGELILK